MLYKSFFMVHPIILTYEVPNQAPKMGRMAHRKWKEIKQQPRTAGPGNMLGCCLLSFHFLWAILCPQAVVLIILQMVQFQIINYSYEVCDRVSHQMLYFLVNQYPNGEISSLYTFGVQNDSTQLSDFKTTINYNASYKRGVSVVELGAVGAHLDPSAVEVHKLRYFVKYTGLS